MRDLFLYFFVTIHHICKANPSGLAPTADLLFESRQKVGKKRLPLRGAFLSPELCLWPPWLLMTPTMLRGDSPYSRHSASRWPDVTYRSGSAGVCNSRADWLRTTANSQAGPTKRCCFSIAATVLKPSGHRAPHAAQPKFLLVTFLCAQRKVTRLSGRDPTVLKAFC